MRLREIGQNVEEINLVEVWKGIRWRLSRLNPTTYAFFSALVLIVLGFYVMKMLLWVGVFLLVLYAVLGVVWYKNTPNFDF